MYWKNFIKMIITVLLFIALSTSAYAMPNDEQVEDFMSIFNLTNEQLTKVDIFDSEELYDEDIDVNDFGTFYLNKGFSDSSIITFSMSKNISGKGNEGTLVGMLVYTFDETNAINTIYQDIQLIGASGLYNNILEFQLGDNYLVAAVKDNDNITYRLFKVNVKEEETKELLENIQIKFIDESNADESNTNIDFLKTILEQINGK